VNGSGPLARVPPAAAFLVVLVLFGAGVWMRGPVGAGLLFLLSAGVVVLLVGTWQALRPQERMLRVLVVFILAGVAVSVLR
jgi:predicted phage tail protein